MKRRLNTETPTNPRDPSSSPVAAADPRWVILNCYGCGDRGGDDGDRGGDDGDRVIADAKTVAESRTSTGQHFRVSMGLAPPPACSYLTSFLLCDMAADKASPPKLRYVRLPADLVGDDEEEANEEYTSNNDDPPSMKCSRNMCAAGAGAVRLVSVDSRCCCCGPGSSTCKRSRFAFTVTTWTLKLRTTTKEEPMMTWVQDGVLDCDELWALPEYGSLPRVPLEYPVVSSDDPDVVCFRVRNDYSCYLEDEDRKVWLLEVDTRRKRLRSVLPTTIPYWKEDSDNIQAKFHY